VAVLAAACAADPPRTLEQQQSDMKAMKEFYSRLDSDQNYYYPHVTIRVEKGVAHLSGYVWNAQALYRAKDVASSVPGITSVVDTLELERDGLR
jgi:osmotically-inducible protein OsmY